MRYILAALLLFAPTISISATANHGDTVLISGSWFGSKSPAAPYFWAPLETSINPSPLGIHTSWDEISSMAYVSGEGPAGVGALKATNNGGVWTGMVASTGTFSWAAPGQKMYIYRKLKHNFSIFTPVNFNWESWRVWGDIVETGASISSMDGIWNGSLSMNSGWTVESGQDLWPLNGQACFGPVGQWNTNEILMRSNTNAVGYGDGYFQYKTNGASCGTVPYEAQDGTRHLKLWDGNATPRLQRNYVVHGVQENHTMGPDDRYWANSVYLDTTWARVMIGNASTLGASTQLEMQIPTAWSENSITVKFNKGSFSTGQTAYLYVINSDNNPNTDGFPVTIGGGDTTPPVISSPLPTGTQAYGTSSVTLQVTTDESATCKYSATDVAYASMGSTFGSTGGTTHQQPGFTTANGQSYTRYVRCIDGSGNANTSSTAISFSVSGTPGGPVVRAECASPPTGTIFCADFEEASDAARRAVWNDYDGATDVVFATDSGPSQDGANTVARFLAGSGQPYGADLVKVLPAAYDKLYLRYYQFFDAGYSTTWGGHGGGLTAGNRNNIGMSGSRPDGTDYADFSIEVSTAGHTRSYNYSRGMYQDCSNPAGSCWGDSFPCDYDSGAIYCTKPHHIKHSSVSWPTFSTGTWRCVEQMIDMGGSAASNLDGTDPNGRYQIWIDGVPLGDYEDLWLRTSTGLKLQHLYMAWRNTSGTAHGSVGQRFDNIIVSTQRVGCGTSTTDKTEPTTSNVLPTGTVSSPATLSFSTSETCAAAYAPTRVGHRYKTPFTTTNGTSHSASVAFANGNKTEYYTCMDAAGNISVPAVASFFVGDSQAPTDPSNLTATPASTTQINLSWTASTDNAGIVGYNIERCQGAACTSWAEIQATSGAGTTYNNTGLTADTTYRYRVRARDAAPNYSGYSPIASATTTITYTVTGAVSGGGGTISPSSQTVNVGSAATLTVTPNAGYTASASGCGGSLAGTTYTTVAITANCTVTATFADTTAPTVAITAPTAGAYVAGESEAVTASASDNSGTVAGIQFKLDGANLGAEDTTPPFAITWNTTTASEGAHSLTATARDAAGNSATSAGIAVTVDNVAPVTSNPLPNGTLMVGTTGVTLRATTSENADCRYSATSGFTWGAGTPYSTTGGTAHSSAVTVAGGRNYRYYSRCLDPAGNPSNTVVSAFFVPRKPMHKVW